MKLLISLLFIFLSCSTTSTGYPESWWKPVAKKNLKWWEISPDSAKAGEVILSKRNELGVLSNFAPTPFVLEGKRYATLEGFWQSMKYPEDENDPRFKAADWPYTRSEVEQLDGFKAKKAGDFGSKIMKKLSINWVSYKGERLEYRTQQKGKHYHIILKAMREKLRQNNNVKDILLKTGDLILKADHKVSKTDPPAWKYYDIWMKLRKELRN